jgi:hypothetical protein
LQTIYGNGWKRKRHKFMKKSDYFLLAFIGLAGYVGARHLSASKSGASSVTGGQGLASIDSTSMGWNPYVFDMGELDNYAENGVIYL